MKISTSSILFAAGILISLFFVISMPDLYFQKDLDVFWAWAQVWDKGWQNIYVNCSDCNYPIIGMLGSAGLLNAFSGVDFEKAVLSFEKEFFKVAT